jgi:hypothetical protein
MDEIWDSHGGEEVDVEKYTVSSFREERWLSTYKPTLRYYSEEQHQQIKRYSIIIFSTKIFRLAKFKRR